mgnify:FL=1
MSRKRVEYGATLLWDKDEAFKLCVDAHSKGESMAAALAVRYRISPSNARSRVSRLRAYGYRVPSQLGYYGQRPLSPCGSAGAVVRHRAAGESCAVCTAAYTAAKRVYRENARLRQAETAPPAGVLRPQFVVPLRCDCGWCCGSIPELIEHTLTVHGRAPTKDERTPR